MALLICRDDRLARRVLLERDCLSLSIASNAMSWTVEGLVRLDMDRWIVLFPHDVVFVGHQNGIVARVRKLLPVIDMVLLE